MRRLVPGLRALLRLPQPQTSSLAITFLHQSRSPLIYILLAAALVHLLLSDLKDALFVGVVLIANGIIGALQEHTAGKAALALRRLEQPKATVIRDGHLEEIDARLLVPGDMVSLEAGGRVPTGSEISETTATTTGVAMEIATDTTVAATSDGAVLAGALDSLLLLLFL